MTKPMRAGRLTTRVVLQAGFATRAIEIVAALPRLQADIEVGTALAASVTIVIGATSAVRNVEAVP
jgi:hypothetical protein